MLSLDKYLVFILGYARQVAVEYGLNPGAVVQKAQQGLSVISGIAQCITGYDNVKTSGLIGEAVALFLEQAIGPREAEAYLLMENRLHGLTILPSVVSVLKRYLADCDQGQYHELADYLPQFGDHLRSAVHSSSH